MARPTKTSKKLPPIMDVKSADLSESADLAKESRLLKKFRNCPSILNTYGSDVTEEDEGEKLFNVFLEYAQRGTIEDCIKTPRNFELFEQHVRKYTLSVLKGLKYIHDKGFVHCDIKRANIFLVSNDPKDTGFGSYVAKIGDFRLAKRATKNNVVKRSEQIHGTGLYMSPKVSIQNILEPSVDIWALGCSVLQMLTGK
ncbi:putative mitogen-activated protein kinase kinase kinase STE-STE11 family [Rosa chinensis]|uniref:Putative mitogen-activated protein kinase kinase kinase STE-STE11 family n=2 Tax=Rosa chinensis TaxID=74649 RepID=A0A2P6RZ50_ROSCH|nr:putative mitogen-activated protein kinase kinase kinase STE-STE11 family [Rosa chinensis]